jgi:anti-sigma-K factor RskA
MRKPNYHQAKKQKEFARKARQQEKQQRKGVRVEPEGGSPQTGVPEGSQSAGGSAADNPVGSEV